MTNSALILGSTGRFGRAASAAFRAKGWRVTEWRRPDPDAGDEDGVVRGDLFDAHHLARAAEVDVIVNGLNPPYPDWAAALPRITDAVIGAARATNATVLIPGNVYNYGKTPPPVLTEATPHVGDHRKARLRIEMEAAYRAAGVATIILRAGDFIDTAPGDNWFEGQISAGAAKGKSLYPGPLDRLHAWAYLPDLARAAEALAARRADLPQFCDIGFPGYALDGRSLLDLIDAAMGRQLRRGRLPWPLVRMMGLFNPMMREVAEMRYLWTSPHQIDGAAFDKLFPDFVHTDPLDAVRASLKGCADPASTPLAPAVRGAITA